VSLARRVRPTGKFYVNGGPSTGRVYVHGFATRPDDSHACYVRERSPNCELHTRPSVVSQDGHDPVRSSRYTQTLRFNADPAVMLDRHAWAIACAGLAVNVRGGVADATAVDPGVSRTGPAKRRWPDPRASLAFASADS
jgi:hypothetical protein